ncbi:hypothetical protein [Streptomyces sp. RFCAC02]|uniref:hypothetical protein n=1 Tax=Streptomyces sp. RFCAC02 TaxID=2499143 RepID=UPI001021CB7E|nr:hypothetical protein [Streptomyces sp. RFCAC02]
MRIWDELWAGRWERRATARSGPAAPRAAGRLCRAYRRRTYPFVGALVRVMCRAVDERAAGRARAALEQAWDGEPSARGAIWYAIERMGDLPYPAALFLTAPVRDSRFVPAVRLVGALSGGRHDDGLLGADHIVEAARSASDPRTRRAVQDVLRVTDHPALLDAMTRLFTWSLRSRQQGGDGVLWDREGRPTVLTHLLLENPHAYRPPQPYEADPDAEPAVLAILKGRPDAVAHHDARRLVPVLLSVLERRLPAAVSEPCRRVLRDLPPGPAREVLCRHAMDGDATARAIAADAGLRPADGKRLPLFLFCTEQWEAYDRIDPRGAKLRAYRRSYGDADWERLTEVAERTGRACPPRPRPARTSSRRTAPTFRPGGTGTAGTGGFSVHGV